MLYDIGFLLFSRPKVSHYVINSQSDAKLISKKPYIIFLQSPNTISFVTETCMYTVVVVYSWIVHHVPPRSALSRANEHSGIEEYATDKREGNKGLMVLHVTGGLESAQEILSSPSWKLSLPLKINRMPCVLFALVKITKKDLKSSFFFSFFF